MSIVTSKTRFRLLIAALLVPLFGLGMIAPAAAHDGTSTVVFLDIFADGTFEGTVEHPVVLLNELFDFDLDPDEADEADLDATQNVMRDFNTESLSITVDGQSVPITFTDTVIVETENRLYAGFNFVVDRTFDDPPRVFEVSYTGIFDEVPGHIGYVVVRTDPSTGTFRNDLPVAGSDVPQGTTFETDLLTTTDPTSSVDLDNPDSLKALWATIDLGMEHIFIGTDHILFILVLLLPAVMIFSLSRTWEPVPSFRAGLWRVLKIATAFTIAHSITLTLGGLEIVELPPKLVETVIALSIIATAAHNLRPVFANKEHWIAFGFGIFHGFGFAGLLSDLGIGRGQRLISLLGFNLGVEIGQAFIILLLLPALYLLRRTTIYPLVIRGGSILLALVAAVWAIERVFERDLGIDTVLNRFTKAPRVFVLIAVATAIAAVAREFQRRRNTLRPLPGSVGTHRANEALRTTPAATVGSGT